MLTKTDVRTRGTERYPVKSHVHLTHCKTIPDYLKDAYYRLMSP